MEKSEYRTRIDEMKELLAEGRKEEALDAANAINWRRVHNINSLISGSEIYEACGKLEEARDLLLLAYDRTPIGRVIVSRLCEISIKLDDIPAAEEFCEKFVELAPHDSIKYILRYKIAQKKKANVKQLIGILEELKQADFIEEWAFELAYLYHQTSQSEKCVQICDEIILWFGEGPFVEQALELKMLYQPLDKRQEDVYRHLQQKKEGITEIEAHEPLHSGEIVPRTITIPSIELTPERFNTINLQAEIKKSIFEIMKATETTAVSENLESIKSLTEEIPYLQLSDEEKAKVEQEAKNEIEKLPKDDTSVNDKFQSYLEEEYDGQISFLVPVDEKKEDDEQIEGQMTIEDVMEEWAKMARAAEAAITDVKEQQLQEAKIMAIKEATQVLEKLEGVMPKLDAGMTSSDILKEEYMAPVADLPKASDVIKAATTDDYNQGLEQYIATDVAETFVIPKLDGKGNQEGQMELPVFHVTDKSVLPLDNSEKPAIIEADNIKNRNTTSWMPPILSNVTETVRMVEESMANSTSMETYIQASAIMTDVNKLLQNEIDKLISFQEKQLKALQEKTVAPVEEDKEETEALLQAVSAISQVSAEADGLEEMEDLDDTASEFLTGSEKAQPQPKDVKKEADPLDEMENLIDLNVIVEDEESALKKEQETIAALEAELIERQTNENVVKQALLDVESAKEDEKEENDEPVIESVSTDVSMLTLSEFALTPQDAEIFSYFMPIDGMDEWISKTLVGAINHIERGARKSGHILIMGEKGTGKTQLATGLIKSLQNHIGRPNGGIGKISGDKINQKDIRELFSKIPGGCLIIESAGRIAKETAITMGLLLNNDATGILVILEDSKKGIEKALSMDASFAKLFTESIEIPAFTIDDLVAFAKTYAREAGYSIDAMGTLALYDRINCIGRYDHATSVSEVSEIMDAAIAVSNKAGFLKKHSSKRRDEEGLIILREKDFQAD